LAYIVTRDAVCSLHTHDPVRENVFVFYTNRETWK